MLDKVEIRRYDPNWPKLFECESRNITTALGNWCVDIHHVGSTSIEGLASKPKLDIIACVNDLSFPHAGLIDLGYEYRGGFNLPFRKSFTHRSGKIDVNLHIFENGDPEIELNLLFRDYLRNNHKERDAYAQLKYDLLKDDSSHVKNEQMFRGYTLGKNDFIQRVLKKVGFNRLRFVIATHYKEWDMVRDFRKIYFELNKISHGSHVLDIESSSHKHFILYRGVEIVGYAHIELNHVNKVTIHGVAIDKKHENKGYDKEFRAFIVKWMAISL